MLDDARRHAPGSTTSARATSTERLALLLAEVEADDNVWKAHKAQFVEHCVKAAANRLRIQRLLDRATACSTTSRSTGPIVVVGLPRSGSTHLENLIAADRRLRHLPVYLGAEPVPQPGEAPGPDGVRSALASRRRAVGDDEPEPDHGRDARALARPRVRRERAADARLRQLPVGMDGRRARSARPLSGARPDAALRVRPRRC